MILLNDIAVHCVSQAPGLSNQDVISCSPAVSTNAPFWRHFKMILRQLTNPFLSSYCPLCHVPVISHSPIPQLVRVNLTSPFVGFSYSCPYRGLNTVLADWQEIDNALLACGRKHTLVLRLLIYFPEHMIER
jgi:hypothetical protein